MNEDKTAEAKNAKKRWAHAMVTILSGQSEFIKPSTASPLVKRQVESKFKGSLPPWQWGVSEAKSVLNKR